MDITYILVIFFIINGIICGQITDLTGNTWRVINSNKTVSVSAIVPGQIHMDLYRNNIIKDPYMDNNLYDQFWVAHENWTYSRNFDLITTSAKRHFLVMNGLDTVVNVKLNGKSILDGDNMHRRYIIDITNTVKPTGNTLDVEFISAILWANNQQKRHPYNVRDEVDNFGISGIHRAFIRKAQSDFGWDWGPVFVPCGIYRDIYIHSVNGAFITDLVPIINEDGDNFIVNTKIYTHTAENVYGKIILSLPQLSIYGETDIITNSATEYESIIKLTVPKKSIEIWWPSGLGKQPLYNLSAVIEVGAESHQIVKRVGFRTVKIRTDTSPKNDGNLMYFEVNGVPVFAKGSNIIPFDAFESRVTDQQIKDLFKAAVYSNNNMFRIWGGGLYQKDSLYEMADEMGIMIWQEFMFACTRVPTHKSFLDTVRMEVRYQVRRLAHHSSLVLWSANNENFESYTKSDVEEVLEYSKIYTQTCYDEMARIDPIRAFLPASPSFGVSLDDRELGLLKINWVQKGKQGDVHRYDYYSLCTNIRNYPKTRFASEYGYQSFPSKYTLYEELSPSNFDIKSSAILNRQHHGSGFNELDNIIRFIFNLPNTSNSTLYLYKYIYLSQAIQAVCMSTQAEFYRRAMSDPDAYCMGSLYWQLNDIWAGVTWASIEYNGNWKLLHYASKRFYSDVLISPFDDNNNNINIYVISDKLTPINCILSIRVYDWKGTIINKLTNDITTPIHNSTSVYTDTWTNILKGKDKKEAFVMLTLTDKTSNTTLSTNWMFPNNNYGGFKDIQLAQAKLVSADFKQLDDTRIQFTLSTDNPAPFVYMQTKSKGYFSDNGMVVVPSEPMDIIFNAYTKITVEELRSTLEITSLMDVYNN